MVVEFNTVNSSSEEMHERRIQQEKGIIDVPYYHSEDYIGKVVVDMDTIIDFSMGVVSCNDQMLDCVYVSRVDMYDPLPNLLIDYASFSKIFEKAKGIKITKAHKI